LAETEAFWCCCGGLCARDGALGQADGLTRSCRLPPLCFVGACRWHRLLPWLGEHRLRQPPDPASHRQHRGRRQPAPHHRHHRSHRLQAQVPRERPDPQEAADADGQSGVPGGPGVQGGSVLPGTAVCCSPVLPSPALPTGATPVTPFSQRGAGCTAPGGLHACPAATSVSAAGTALLPGMRRIGLELDPASATCLGHAARTVQAPGCPARYTPLSNGLLVKGF